MVFLDNRTVWLWSPRVYTACSASYAPVAEEGHTEADCAALWVFLEFFCFGGCGQFNGSHDGPIFWRRLGAKFKAILLSKNYEKGLHKNSHEKVFLVDCSSPIKSVANQLFPLKPIFHSLYPLVVLYTLTLNYTCFSHQTPPPPLCALPTESFTFHPFPPPPRGKTFLVCKDTLHLRQSVVSPTLGLWLRHGFHFRIWVTWVSRFLATCYRLSFVFDRFLFFCFLVWCHLSKLFFDGWEVFLSFWYESVEFLIKIKTSEPHYSVCSCSSFKKLCYLGVKRSFFAFIDKHDVCCAYVMRLTRNVWYSILLSLWLQIGRFCIISNRGK